MNKQNYTKIDRSKHLLELGLDSETADMVYMFFRVGGGLVSTVPFFKEELDLTERGEDCIFDFIPCWSLSALLELMPTHVKIEKSILFETNPVYYGRLTGSTVNDTFDAHYSTVGFNTPIDAAYSMVMWLLENNYIKKQ